MKRPLLYLLILLVTVFSTSCTQSSKGTFEVGDKTFLLNGEPFVVKAAEIHYPRIPKEYWEHRLRHFNTMFPIFVCRKSGRDSLSSYSKRILGTSY